MMQYVLLHCIILGQPLQVNRSEFTKSSRAAIFVPIFENSTRKSEHKIPISQFKQGLHKNLNKKDVILWQKRSTRAARTDISRQMSGQVNINRTERKSISRSDPGKVVRYILQSAVNAPVSEIP